jgi:hypothetical protein
MEICERIRALGYEPLGPVASGRDAMENVCVLCPGGVEEWYKSISNMRPNGGLTVSNVSTIILLGERDGRVRGRGESGWIPRTSLLHLDSHQAAVMPRIQVNNFFSSTPQGNYGSPLIPGKSRSLWDLETQHLRLFGQRA